MEEQSKKSPVHPQGEVSDYRDTWRIFRIMAELVEGYNFLDSLEKEVTIFGSARFPEGHEHYETARAFGKLLGENGITTITGGGPGIMQGANHGAFEAKGESVGLNIQLPFEQRVNPYVTKSTAFYYFFTRKVMMTSPANAFIFFPGGFGTLDEFFEVVDNMDLGMMGRAPIVLVNKEFWTPIVEFLKEHCCTMGTVPREFLESWHLVDTAEEAYDKIKDIDESKMACDLSPNNFHCDKNIDWKIFRVMAELVEGFEFVSGVSHAVTVLGTKSLGPQSRYYDAAHRLGQFAADANFAVVTGGKKGIAEAANKGAFEAGGTSIGLGMKIGKSREVNSYLSKSILFSFPFTRKLIVTAPTKAFVFFPGGLGTMHQLFEILTLIQTKKMPPVPIILFDHKFWGPLHSYIKETMVHDVETISDEDDELYQIVDDEESIMKIITESHNEADH